MDESAFVDVVESYSYLEEAIEDSFGVEVLVLICEEALLNPVPEGFAFEFL
jgi:hypothetical protein